jgi:heme-degrading monooxygenase HmoA
LEERMIVRIWHGWTAPANADAYEHLLREEILAGIEAREIAGFHGIQLLRRDVGGEGDEGEEVEFVTIMRFDDLAAVAAFAGPDYEQAVVPPAAQKLLARFDARSAHYELRAERGG